VLTKCGVDSVQVAADSAAAAKLLLLLLLTSSNPPRSLCQRCGGRSPLSRRPVRVDEVTTSQPTNNTEMVDNIIRWTWHNRLSPRAPAKQGSTHHTVSDLCLVKGLPGFAGCATPSARSGCCYLSFLKLSKRRASNSSSSLTGVLLSSSSSRYASVLKCSQRRHSDWLVRSKCW